ncbi:hypothetical protein [Nocardia sp. NPDC052566]|uniref:hypothetical protein n=1 Tax=Nocardia sp. NPDC052566 TaxID=3364330 RepID=UPI0037C79E6D
MLDFRTQVAKRVKDRVIGLVSALHLIELSEAVPVGGDATDHFGDHRFRDGVEFR